MKISLLRAKIRSAQRRRAQYWAITRRHKRQERLTEEINAIRERRGAPAKEAVPKKNKRPELLEKTIQAIRERRIAAIKPKIGNLIPKKMLPEIIQYYELLANVPIITGYFGDVELDAGTSDFLNQHGFRKAGDFMALRYNQIQRLENYRAMYLNQIFHALISTLAKIKETNKIPGPPRIGNWIPDDLWQLIDTHYEVIAEIHVADGYLGNVPLDARVANMFETRNISQAGKFMNLPGKYMLSLRNFGKTSLRATANALRAAAEAKIGQSSAISQIGDWIPQDQRSSITKYYKIIAMLPPNESQLDYIKFSERAANALSKLRDHGVKELGEILNLPERVFLKWKNFDSESLQDTTDALRSIVAYLEDNIQSKSISIKTVDMVLSTLPPSKLKEAVEMRFGFSPSGKSYVWREIGQDFGLSRETGRQKVERAIRKLRHPSRKRVLEDMRRSITNVASEILGNKIVLTLEELKAALKERNLLEEDTEAYFVQIMHLLDHVLGKYFTYVYIKNGEKAPKVTKKNIWLVRDFQKYSDVLPSFCKRGEATEGLEENVWEFEEYQKMLEETHDISISIPELKKIFKSHRKINIVGNIFYPREKGKAYALAMQLIKEKGSLHYEDIAEHIGATPRVAHRMLQYNKEFILYGRGIFGRLKERPGQLNVPYPDVKRKAAVWGAVHDILTDSPDKLTPKEIHEKIAKKRYTWTLEAVKRILKDKKYQDFFVEENGKYGLRLQEDPDDEIA